MTNKPFLLFQGPARSRSGYGDHTRDLITSLIDMDKFDIKIAPTQWGSCPETGLDMNIPSHRLLQSKLVTNPKLPKQPDIYINCSVPNEFNPIGRYNIGITAGIETTICDASWIEGCNKMDLIIVPSMHSKRVLENTVYDKIDKQNNKKIGEARITKPIEVLFEGLDTTVYKKLDKIVPTVDNQLKNIKESFCFLYVGHWLHGKISHDRKDTGMLIKTFCNAFKSKRQKPALILKSSQATFSIIDRNQLLKRIAGIKKEFGNNCPNVYLLHGDLTPEEMNGLYNHPKVKAHITFTKGEGFGRPLLEASVSQKPIIASNWSGQLDFLHPEYCTLLPGELKEVHPSAQWKGVINQGSQWFYVNYSIAEKIIRDVYKSYKSYIPGARKQGHYCKTNFSMNKMTEGFSQIINKHVKFEQQPQQVKLNLPKLKKVGDESPPKLNLPKLKKV